MRLNNKLLVLPLLSIFLLGCSINNPATVEPISLEERLNNAYLDVIETKEENIRPLINISLDEKNITWNEDNNQVLLFTLHRFPDSYPDGEDITFSWGESWLCSVKELQGWYINNKDNIKDPLLRIKQLLGMSHESKNTYLSSLWIGVDDLIRPAYVTDVNKPMATSFDENVSEEYKAWFINQYYYSYDVNKLPWTRLGYTYDWSEEAKDKYGLSEFIAFKGTTAKVDKTLPVEDFLKTL